jgi:pSer/pThr/pTyr-binding forkhead associated (FHA) protein
VLESLSQEKNNSRIIYIIRPSAQKDVFKLGRGHESDLRINDISVSRCHAKIKLENGKFLLEDNQSKFGTLVLVKQRTPLLPNYNKAVQVGRTVINFSVKPQNNQNQGQNNYSVSRLKSRIPGFAND